MRIKPKRIPAKELYKLLDEFYSIVTLLESKEEVKNFFKDLLSVSEALMLGRRIKIAKLLIEGSSYQTITSEIGASHATIAGVQRWLDAGFGGYLKAIGNLNKKLQEKEAEYARKYNNPWGELKRKYPTYFALSGFFEQLSKWAEEREKKKRKRSF
jgi:TrpR-related protein YerC/YecD